MERTASLVGFSPPDGHDLESAIQAALQANPDDVDAQVAQVLLHLGRGQPPLALKRILPLVQSQPQHPGVALAWGRVQASMNRLADARVAFERARELAPASEQPWLELAQLALRTGRLDEADVLLQGALARQPDCVTAHFERGQLALRRGDIAQAEQHLRRTLELDGRHAAALGNLGSLLKDRGASAEAATCLEQALALQPDLAPVAFNLAMLRIGQGRWADAVELLRQSLRADPRQADAQYALGNALMGAGQATEARQAYAAAIRLDGAYVPARWGLVMAQLPAVPHDAAEPVAALPAFRTEFNKLRAWLRAQSSLPIHLAVGAQQPYYLAYIEQNHRAMLADYGQLCAGLMGQWASRVKLPAVVQAVGSKLRVGIVSAHVHHHSVWHALVRGWVEHLPSDDLELHLFHTGAGHDDQTDCARARVAGFHAGAGDWQAWVRRLTDARMDVLIYPEIGMDATTLKLASLRLARRQLVSWGHPLTTGLPTIDGFITAQALEAPDAQSHYTEPLIALPRLGCCYRWYGTTPAARLDLAAWGVAEGDRLLLCAGTPFKYAPRHDAVLVDVARRCAPCKLLFFRPANSALGALLEQRLRRAFDQGGLSFDQHVRFIPWLSQAEFFALLQRATVFLDSLGFSGFNTAMQALECGTPIVAWEGQFLRGRLTSGILQQAGLHEWVARDVTGYVERIARLCNDSAARAALSHQLVSRRAALPNDQASVHALADVLRQSAP